MPGHLRTLDGQEYPVGDSLPPVECFRCGACCVRYQPPLLPGEVASIAAGLKLSGDDFLAKYGQLTYIGYLLRREGNKCVFLDVEAEDKASCRIHPFRPRACRNWAASLSRRECREGLARMKTTGKLLLPGELYPSPEDLDGFSGNLR